MELKVFFVLILIVFSISTRSQEIDTIHLKQIQTLELQIDSLCHVIQSLDTELQQFKDIRKEDKAELDELFSIFDEDDIESSSFERRSKRKRVDALLEAITKRPGQLRFNGDATSIFQGTYAENNWDTYGTGSFDIFAHTSFGTGTLLFFDLEAIGGNGPEQHYPTYTGLNGDAGSTQSRDSIDRITILEAWGEFTMFHDAVTITLGKIDLTNYFDINASANDETMQFISGSFINSTSFAVPGNSPGIRFRTSIRNKYHVQLGFASTDNAGANLLHDIYSIASIGWTFAPGSDFESNIRMYGFQHPMANHSYGWGLSFDKVIFKNYNIFGRFGYNSDSTSSYWGIQSSWSAGTRFVKTIAKQALAIGIAYGENIPGNTQLKNEKVAEMYIRRQLNKWIHISPHFQYIMNRDGTNKELIVFGLRTHFNF